MSKNYIQIRFQKVKGAGAVKAILAHNDRTQESIEKKVNASKSHENVYNSNKKMTPYEAWEKKRSRYPMRKNGVDMLESVISISNDQNIDTKLWHNTVLRFALRKFGKDALVLVTTHVDEKTTHSHIDFLPLVDNPKKPGEKKMSADAILGNKKKLSQWQTDVYNEVGKVFDLERGRRKTETGRENSSLQKWRKKMDDAANTVEEEVKGSIFEIRDSNKKLRQQVNALAVQKAKLETELEIYQTANENQIHTIRKHSKEKEQLNSAIETRDITEKKLREMIRTIDLNKVMDKWGFTPVRSNGDETVFKTDLGNLCVNTSKQVFSVDWGSRKGGKGAIDLVCTLDTCKPLDAVKLLLTAFDRQEVSSAYAWHQVKYREELLPEPASIDEQIMLKAKADETKWDGAKNYLISRGIDEGVVNDEHSKERIWANNKGSVCFGRYNDDGRKVGVSIRGTQEWSKDFKQNIGSKEDGLYSIGDPKDGETILTESAIDALSLHQSCGKKCVSVDGNSAPENLLKTTDNIWIGFDSDEDGERGFVEARKVRKDVQRLKPRLKDWNEDFLKFGPNSLKDYVMKIMGAIKRVVHSISFLD